MASIGNPPATVLKSTASSRFWRKTLTAATTTITGADDYGFVLDFADGTEILVRNGVVLTPVKH
jgi:hypothetical protein